MNLDLGSFAFGSSLKSGGGTPSWGTALGQAKPYYKFTYPGAEAILIGMMYCSVPLTAVSLPLGKGGHIYQASELEECQLASLFRKVYINGIRIDYPFIMVLIKENSDSHAGRKSIKYCDKNAYQSGSEKYTNQEFIRQAKQALNLSENACWFVYNFEVYNQDELHMSAVFVDENNSVEYFNSSERKNKWIELIPDSIDFNISRPLNIDRIESLQKIYYGAPGTGKSHKIKNDENVKEANKKNFVFRTTFHPDSDYSTFVGTYKPTIAKRAVRNVAGDIVKNTEKEDVYEDCIIYSFIPQAFLQAYTTAWNNQEEKVYLIIEEINRGNCAQIFGDLFQLLDRDDEGFSEYPIMADIDLKKYLNGKDEEGKDVLNNKDGIKDGKLRLPNNLYIWATMNTSDQSLFPIDSAFKRRWDWIYMPIDTKKDTWFIKVGEKRYSWTKFLDKINNDILTDETAEDKHLGFYFCKAENNEISQETFVGKVLFYLWNDVFKVYGIPSAIGSSKEWAYTKFYNPDGSINEQKVIDLMKKLQIAPEGSNEGNNENIEEKVDEQ